MGGVSAKQDGVVFEAREEYMRWSLSDVKSAVLRWHAVSKRGSLHISAGGVFQKFGVNRREFWEIFTDYAVLRDGAFLCLPVEYFAVFDPDGTNLVFVLEVIMMVLLFCHATPEEKVRYAFSLFDFNDSGSLIQTDMCILIRAVLTGFHRSGVIKRLPGKKAINKRAAECFETADVNGNGMVSLDEFEAWAHKHLESQALLLEHGYTRQAAGKKKSGLPELRKKHAHRMDAATRELVSHRLPNGRRSSLASRMSRTIIEQARLEAKEGTVVPDVLLKDDKFLEVKRLDTMARARKLMTIATRKTLSDLVKKTSFTLIELGRLLENFVDASDATGRLDRPTFHTVLMKHAPGLTEDGIINRVHEVLDTDADGFINYKELCLGLSTVMRGSMNDKLNMLFNIYDADGSNTISIVELVTLIRKNDVEFMHLIEFAEEVVASLDINGDDQITREEFTEALRKDAMVLDIFAQCTAISKDKLKACHTLKRDHTEHTLTFETLLAYVDSTGTERQVLMRQLDTSQFRAFMAEHFGFGEAAEHDIDNVHIAFDPKRVGTVCLRDVLNGLAHVSTVSLEQRASFYFSVWDLDGSGDLDKNEVMHMLLSASEKTNSHAATVLKMLAELDRDCDGTVSLDEFTERASRQPLLMETLERMFMVRGDIDDVLAPANGAKRRGNLRVAVASAAAQGRRTSSHKTRGKSGRRSGSRKNRGSLTKTAPLSGAGGGGFVVDGGDGDAPSRRSSKSSSDAGASSGAGAGSGAGTSPSLPHVRGARARSPDGSDTMAAKTSVSAALGGTNGGGAHHSGRAGRRRRGSVTVIDGDTSLLG